MFELASALDDVGYRYMLMPDHAPDHPDDQGVGQAAAAVVGGVTTGRRKQPWAVESFRRALSCFVLIVANEI